MVDWIMLKLGYVPKWQYDELASASKELAQGIIKVSRKLQDEINNVEKDDG